MRIQSFFKSLIWTSARRRPIRRSPLVSRLGLEALEDRCLLSFSPAVFYPAGLAPLATVASDFNNDGHTDLAVANGGSNTVSVLLGNGDGAFQAARTSATGPDDGTGPDVVSVLTGDLNGDWKTDLVLVNHSYYSSRRLSVLLGNGDGLFQAPRDIVLPAQMAAGYSEGPLAQTPIPNSSSAVLGDLNADGRLDLIAVGGTQYRVEIGYDWDTQSPIYEYVGHSYVNTLLGNGDGTFGPGSTYRGGGNLELGDFDGNGKLDVVIYAGQVSTMLGNGDGTLQAPRPSPTIAFNNGSVGVPGGVADFNGDGKLDVLTGAGAVLGLGTGDGTFQWTGTAVVNSGSSLSIVGDVNADGKLDVVELGRVQLGNGDGTFALSILSNLGAPPGDTGFNSAVLADFDGDGYPDLAGSTSWYDPEYYWCYFPGFVAVSHNDGTWTQPPPPPPSITMSDVTITEGNTGTRAANFTVTLSHAYNQPVTVAYVTANGSAAAGSDYQATSGTLTIPAGLTTGTITVLVKGDRLGEENETYYVNLSSPTNATIADGQGLGIILNDEPRISINDVTVTEGNTGTKSATFTVSLLAAYDLPVTVHFATADGIAAAGSDYTAASGNVTIAVGQTTKTLTVAVGGDRLAEPNEWFFVNLSSPTNGTIADSQGEANIVDDEPRISISDVTKSEGKKNQTTLFTFTVTLSAAYDQAVTMSYATANGTAKTSDSDYVAKTGTLTFAPGETSKTITIEVQGDAKKEANEMFYLDLLGNSGNSLFTKRRGIGEILNDD